MSPNGSGPEGPRIGDRTARRSLTAVAVAVATVGLAAVLDGLRGLGSAVLTAGAVVLLSHLRGAPRLAVAGALGGCGTLVAAFGGAVGDGLAAGLGTMVMALPSGVLMAGLWAVAAFVARRRAGPAPGPARPLDLALGAALAAAVPLALVAKAVAATGVAAWDAGAFAWSVVTAGLVAAEPALARAAQRLRPGRPPRRPSAPPR